MTPASRHDLVILGAGSGGYAAALRASQLGLDVAIVEAGKLGGTCLHRGCIPTKAWLHAAEVADHARDGDVMGLKTRYDGVQGEVLVDWADGVINRLYKGLTGLVTTSPGITQVEGWGTLVSDREGLGVRVGDDIIRGRNVLVATGARPKTLGLTIDGQRIITSDHALKLAELPRTALVIGGGVIGVEIASAWRSLGVDVTIVEALDRLVPAEEPDISKALLRAFTKRGIATQFGVKVAGATSTATDATLILDDGKTLTADLVLVAVGREPATHNLGLTEAGVSVDRGLVRVNDRLMTSVRGVFAVGDVVAGPQLAHRGFAQGMFVAEVVAHQLGRHADNPVLPEDSTLPRVTYCNPEITSVGLTVAAAQRLGEVKSLDYPLGGNGRSIIKGTTGFVRVVRLVDGPIVGVHAIGQGVSELAGEAQLAVGWEALPEDVAEFVHGHPTQGEAFGEACMALAGRPLHVHA
ncbi:dihydrolipoyl dehydrogenase [Propionibacteriaceae bacterium G1746]